MLNWRLEENQFVEERLKEYRKELSGLALMFMSEKQLNKNIAYITEQAKLNYRARKLDDYLDEIKEERENIKKQVEDLTNKLNGYFEEQKALIEKEIEPFEFKLRPYDNFAESTPKQLEVVTIHIKPMKLSFIQEKID